MELSETGWQAGHGEPTGHCGSGQSGQEDWSDGCGSPQRQQHQEEGMRESGENVGE